MPDGSGRMMAIAGRTNIVTAADLVDMIEEMVRKVVREEMRLASIVDKK
jgi:flagellar biosynthesis/type III secretory pathway protein FliH